MPTPDPMTRSVSDADPNAASGVDTSSPSTPHPPVSTQRYLLADEIARGGMGVIYG